MLIYLCDDEVSDQLRVKHFLKLYARQKSSSIRICVFSNAVQMLKVYNKNAEQPQLLLMDILMAEMDGIEAARQMREAGYANRIVFITSSSEHALESFKVYADGFLLKPYTFEEFSYTLDRLAHLFRKSSHPVEIKEVGGANKKLFPETICYLEIFNRNLTFHTPRETIIATGKISDYEELLKEDFVRIGHSFLVNLRHIQDISDGICTLKNGEEISVPVRRRTAVEQEYRKYQEQNGGTI